MRLIALAANVPTFRPVKFNPTGLSIIVGQKKLRSDGTSAKDKTYNGVGKSLLIELIHYCLGSNTNDAFRKHLADWIFTLTIEMDDGEHQIARSAGKPSAIYFDNEKVSLTKLRKRLLQGTFYPVPGIQGLTFRSLIPPFLRSGRAAYERFDRANGADTKNEYWALIRNAFLLGLDLDLAAEKHRLRSRQSQLTKTVKQLESDPVFFELLAEEKAGIELVQLREEESKLENDLHNFTVADDYADVQREANSVKKELETIRRELIQTQEAIAQVDRSLATKGDVDPALVERIYAEAQVSFPEAVRRTIAEVTKFQRDLTQQRVYRLNRDRQQLEHQRSEMDGKIRILGPKLEDKLRYLGSHVALDEYLAVSGRLNELRQRIAKLQASKEQRERVSRELKTIDLQLAEQAIQTDDFLAGSVALVEEANTRFHGFAKRLYPRGASGLTVANDSGVNLLRYRIEAHIPRDAAEGINEAKIFCYDLSVLTLRRGHTVDFLVHDSGLFSPIDHRQRLTIFQIADQVSREKGLQYIAALNEHDITSMEPTAPDEVEAFTQLFSEPNVVLRLTDNSPRDRLLGIDVDMNYWEKNDSRDERDDVDEE
jgi:uncharacterized protein YydD (DUF2326 family)